MKRAQFAEKSDFRYMGSKKTMNGIGLGGEQSHEAEKAQAEPRILWIIGIKQEMCSGLAAARSSSMG